MSQKDELELWKKYKKEGDKEAKKELIHSLKPLIRSQVNKYKTSGLPYDALELEGVNQAAKAIETYDPDKAQLNTHVVNRLRKLSRFTTKHQNVGHIPEPRALMIGKYKTIKSNLEAEKGREPTIDELSDAMQVPPAEIQRLQSEQRADLHMTLPETDDDGGGFSYYIMPDEEDPQAREALEFTYFDAEPVDKKVLEYTFGLGGTEKTTNKEIKAKLGLTETELRKRRKRLAENIRELM